MIILNRIRKTQSEVILYQEGRIDLFACPRVEQVDFSKTAVFDAIEGAPDKKISYAKNKYAARIAGRKRGNLLGCDPMAPVLNMDMVVYLEDNTATEWGSVWLPSNKYVLTSIMQRF